ncbi:MAG: SDR family NAD(P)-dependent oxidoreductase [Gemmataceae bacterium]|nr:SDR family NAD(P)-dependent oxidoreductase [Gemmataceae bacterium]
MTPSSPVALITGTGSGIGLALAHRLAREGYAIAALDRRDDGLRSLADDLLAQGHRIAWALADVTDPPALIAAVRELEAQLGPTDLLVANAGIGLETSGLNYDIAAMNKVLNVNLLGVSNSIGAVLPGMVERRRGHIVGMSSIASYRGMPRMLAYSASKAGVNAIMDGLRVELKPIGIYVTTICPGWIRTPMTAQLEGTLEHMVDLDTAVEEIAYAIRKKLLFHTFPRRMRWKLGFMRIWPLSWQDAMIRSMMNQVNVKKEAE